MLFNTVFPVSFSTVLRPKTRAMKKHSAAPAIALVQESTPPQSAPNNDALAKVITNAGSGAIMACKIIKQNDTTAA